MRCRNCAANNADGRKFCTQCGASLGPRCPKCEFEYPLDAEFCPRCATQLNQDTPFLADVNQNRLTPPGERRHLTVLFCDLAASTILGAQLDAEELRNVVAGFHWAATEAIVQFGGHIAQYLGDGVMAYFGWPQAHDNDAERAVRAGLAILAVVTKLNEKRAQTKLSTRVGIDSGSVVIGFGSKDADVFGPTPNIASRLHEAAQPGTVMITDAVHRLVAGLFVVEDCGAQTVKGVERPLQQFRVIRPSGVRGRLEAAAASHGLTPFVGRETELRSLMDLWELTLKGHGQVALIVGEAGIGKSRLVQRFHEQIGGTPHTWVGAAASPFLQNTPFHPVVDVLHDLLAWRSDSSSEQLLAQLAQALEMAGVQASEALPLIAPLLNLPLPENYQRLTLPPEFQRRAQLKTLVEWILAGARGQPMVIATEDLHWADPSTLELIQLLVDQLASARLLLLLTARPEFRPQWPARKHQTHVNLDRLSMQYARAMVERVAADEALPAHTIATVVERTGGVPLFVEELTRAVLESRDARFTGVGIPASLHDSLMARLDRLGSAKEVAQVGAVLGGEFSYELLRAVHPIAEEDLQRALRTLDNANMVYIRGVVPEATYQFRHALVRDTAYEALLKSRRKELHRLVARTIDERFTSLKETHPEVLARHWTEAGEPRAAITEWSRAGKTAQARNAFKEALESYQQAVAMLTLSPKLRKDESRELELRQAVVSMLYVTSGFAAPETIAAVESAVALAEKSSNLNQMVDWLTSRSTSLLISGELSAAATILDQILDLATRHPDSIDLGTAHQRRSAISYWRGDLKGAEQHFAAALAAARSGRFEQLPLTTITSFGFGGMNAWILGRPALARERQAQMMAAAADYSPFDLANAEYFAARLELYLRDYERAEAFAMSALERAEKHNIPNPVARARCALGVVRMHSGNPAEAVELISQGIAGWRAIGTRMGISTWTTYLAEAQERAGALDDALATIQHALAVHPDERVDRPETFRVRGELLLKKSQLESAEASFREALALAQKMTAKSWELRSAMSLARVLATKGSRDAARDLLTPIYNWFSEGFETADLQDAQVLLSELT
jgi:class 3 adenylate cyclase/tetratricopeptide (TPR) repeat protein